MAPKAAEDMFDVVIVGGGTAGSLVAARLSSDSTLRILVLEAGENRNADANVKTPGLQRNILGNPSYDWQFRTVPESGLYGRVIQQPRGKLWGGSSAIRYHDEWSALLGRGNGKFKESWDWDGVKDYYRSFQSLQQPSDKVRRDLEIGYLDPNDTGGDKFSESMRQEKDVGDIQASFPAAPHVLQKAWTYAIREIGYSSSEDPASGNLLGGSTTAAAIDALKGERSHAGAQFLEPCATQKNLTIRSNTMVKRVVFEEEKVDGNLVATGLVYSQDGHDDMTVYARQYGSPKILELSGIGQRDRLRAVGTKCFQNLAGVGENLQDHLNFGPSVEVLDTIDTRDAVARDPALAEKEQQLYDLEHKGPLAEGGTYSFTHLPLQAFNSLHDENQLEKIVEDILRDGSSTASKGLKAQYKIIQRLISDPKEATSTIFMTRMQRYTPPAKLAPGNYMSIIAMLSYPFSRGSSHITTSIASAHPEIRFNYLQHPLDAEILARHVTHIGKLLESPALSAVLKPGGNTLPAGFPRHATEPEEVKGFLRRSAATNYHPVGTCAMMREDLDGVVDEQLLVYGTINLRVCDASVIPILPRGNILSTVYAVAGKGADILKDALVV